MPTAIVLSGGGAKGDFQVGALKLLYERGIRPDIICGTSVGAINGAKLAEGEGTPDQGLEGLEAIWRELNTTADMYLEEAWLNQLHPPIKKAIVDDAPLDISGPIEDIKEIDPGGYLNLVNVMKFQLPSPFWLLDFGKIAGDVVVEGGRLAWCITEGGEILKSAKLFMEAKSLFTLDPIAWRLRGNAELGIPKRLHEERIAAWSQGGARKLRLAMVSVDSGRLRYVTETGQVLERDGTPVFGLSPTCQAVAQTIEGLEQDKSDLQEELRGAAPGQKPELIAQIRGLTKEIAAKKRELATCLATRTTPITTDLPSGVLASAAIAMLFRPVTIGGETYVDGGFREVVPIRPAFELGADPIYVIVAGRRGGVSHAEAAMRTRPGVDLLLRALADCAVDEVQFDDLDPLGGWERLGRTVKIIQPDLRREVHEFDDLHDLREVDPGLIRIAMAYGYMRAADVLDGATPNDQSWELSNTIVSLRKRIWTLECLFHAQEPTGRRIAAVEGLPEISNPDTVRSIRRLKRELRELVVRRVLEGGPVPADASGWWLEWEKHPWGTATSNPWGRFVLPAGEVEADEPPPATIPPLRRDAGIAWLAPLLL